MPAFGLGSDAGGASSTSETEHTYKPIHTNHV